MLQMMIDVLHMFYNFQGHVLHMFYNFQNDSKNNLSIKVNWVLFKKNGELGKKVFVLEHNSHLILTAMLRNQIRFILKYHLIDCISINLKSD